MLGGKLVFTQDFLFLSPTTATGILVGGSANGRLAWKGASGKTLKAIRMRAWRVFNMCFPQAQYNPPPDAAFEHTQRVTVN
ncbi:DUF4357 domain-containing protein [Halomonas titanicae]|uniref:DUF4357 domain-containing protein n=1 Tax=Vreelandella titanicae TaxID=664683 RepID=UPI001CC26FCC